MTFAKILIGQFLLLGGIGFGVMHAMHGSPTMPGRQSTEVSCTVLDFSFQIEASPIQMLEVFYWLPVRCLLEPVTES